MGFPEEMQKRVDADQGCGVTQRLQVVILFYVRYSGVYCGPPARFGGPVNLETLPLPDLREIEVLQVHRLLYIVVEQPDKTKSIAVRNAAPAVPMAA